VGDFPTLYYLEAHVTRREYWILAEAIAATKMDLQVQAELVKNICKAFMTDSERWNEEKFLSVIQAKCEEKVE
jgi:hypothetical protein